jgi:hypothetical protein
VDAMIDPMAVTQRDRDYMRRLGEYKARAHAQAQQEHLTLGVDERLERSMLLYRQFAAHGRTGGPDDDPREFYERARRLGLYLP